MALSVKSARDGRADHGVCPGVCPTIPLKRRRRAPRLRDTRTVMLRTACLLALFASAFGFAADDEVVFHSDVSLVRVDTQVVDRDNPPVTDFPIADFLLRHQ